MELEKNKLFDKEQSDLQIKIDLLDVDKKKEFQIQMNALDDELDRYSFDIEHITEEEKKKIKDVYTAMWLTSNNKIFIENINKANIRINKKILIDGKEFGNYEITNKTGLHFINCKNITIFISTKVCHITNDHCENLTIKIIGGSVSGMDIINCNHIKLFIEDSTINFLDLSKSEDCLFCFSEENALNTTISSFDSQAITITTTNPNEGIIKNIYKPSISFFEIYRQYSFKIENDLVQLYYLKPKIECKNNVYTFKDFVKFRHIILDHNDKIFVKGERY